MRYLGYLIVASAVFDGLLSSIFFSKFSLDLFKTYLARLVYYNFYEDFIDLWFLGLLRCYILAGVALGIIWRPKVAALRLSVIGHCLALLATSSLLFTLAKLLAATETADWLATDILFWLQISWSSFCSLALIGFSHFLRKQAEKFLTSDRNGSTNNSDSSTDLLGAENRSEDSSPGDRKTGVLRLLSFSKPDAHILATAFAFLLIAAVADVLSPNYVGQVIAGIVIKKSTSDFIRAILLYAVVSVVSSVATGIRGGLFSYSLARLGRRTRAALFGVVLNQEVAFFDQTRTGDIMSRLSSDVTTMTDTLALNLNVFLRNFVQSIGIVFMMFNLSWRLSLITIAGLPVIAASNQIFGIWYEKLSTAVQDAVSKASQVAEEAISNFRTVLSLAGEQIELMRYCDNLNGVFKLKTREAVVYASSIWSTQLLSLSLTLATLYYGGHLVIQGLLDESYLVTFLIYQINLGDCLQSIGSVYTGLMQALGASRKVIEYLDRKPSQKRSGPFKPTSVRGHIEFRNVSFSYPTRKDALILKNISFTVEPGQVVALVGKSGSGKSSCLALLERFYDPTEGEVFFDGRPVGDYDHAFLHRAIAMVSQEPILFARAIRDNILFATDFDAGTDEVYRAAKMADADEFVRNLPSKYDTECGEKGIQLSAGQKQRIAIARALIRKPDVLLLDEATSALDASAEAAVQETLSRAMAGRTVLVVAHRLSTIRNANRILVLENGVIAESGTHDELIALNGHYAALVRKQLTLGANNNEEEGSSPQMNKSKQQQIETTKRPESLSLCTSPPAVPFFKIVQPNAPPTFQGSPDNKRNGGSPPV